MKYKDNFPVSKFFVKIIFIILAILLIVWIYTKYTSNKNHIKNKDNNSKEIVFSKNLTTIKNKSLEYFTEDILNSIPYNDKIKIKLEDLKEKKFITTIKDHNDKQCNLKKSYILMFKTNDNNYKMKIYLLCNDIEDTLEYKLLHSNNCRNFLCETIETKDSVVLNNDNASVNFNNKEESKNITTTNKKYIVKKTPKKNNTATYKGSIEVTDTTTSKYRYQYINNSKIKYTNWSNWLKEADVSCDTKISLNNSEISLREEKISNYTNDEQYKTIKNAYQSMGNIVKKVCKNLDYIYFNNVLYQTNSNYSNLNNWTYIGSYLYKIPPEDTLNTKYIYKNIDYSKCSDTCNGNEQYYFDKYVYNNITIAHLNCSSFETKLVYLYYNIQNTITNYRNEIDHTKCYKEVRTRNIIDYQYIWSNYNNKELLKNGYTYTGKKEYIK